MFLQDQTDEMMAELLAQIERHWGGSARKEEPWPGRFTREEVEAFRAPCLAFEKHFYDFRRGDYAQEPPADDLTRWGVYWVKCWSQLVQIFFELWNTNPDFIEAARAVPELHQALEIAGQWHAERGNEAGA